MIICPNLLKKLEEIKIVGQGKVTKVDTQSTLDLGSTLVQKLRSNSDMFIWSVADVPIIDPR
jgi:hypothetical protein